MEISIDILNKKVTQQLVLMFRYWFTSECYFQTYKYSDAATRYRKNVNCTRFLLVLKMSWFLKENDRISMSQYVFK